jgi:hypothetical protein
MAIRISETYRSIQRKLPAQRRAVVDAALQLGCSQEEAQLISRHAHVRTYTPGHMIARLGSMGGTMHIIVDGDVVVRRLNHEDVTISTRGVIGELSALKENWYQVADVECSTPVTALVFDADQYKAFADARGVVTNLVEDARTVRAGILESERQAARVEAWERYQSIKQYIGR